MDLQRKIDWPRARKLYALDQMRLPDRIAVREGRREVRVRATALRLILRELDAFAREADWCWPRQLELRARTAMSDRDLRRAIRALVELQLLVVERRRLGNSTANRYRIIWGNVEALIVSEPRVGPDAINGASWGDRPESRVIGQTARVIGHGWPISDRPNGASDRPPVADPLKYESLNREAYRSESRKSKTPLGDFDLLRGGEAERGSRYDHWLDRLARSVPVQNGRDRELLASLARQVELGVIPEAAIAEAIESIGIKRPRRPLAWLQACVRNWMVVRRA